MGLAGGDWRNSGRESGLGEGMQRKRLAGTEGEVNPETCNRTYTHTHIHGLI